ncbi:MAG: alanine--tRNA ligase, partial [Chloroflexi bacterium]|nr:alanine--tRNA ligase [Chloroflexota bacterium]
SLEEAKAEGAIALFGEKYGETVRTVTIGGDEPFSYELCGGTHVRNTGDIGTFIITSEGSAAAGIRRIEAVTGRSAYELIRERTDSLRQISKSLNVKPDEAYEKVEALIIELAAAKKELAKMRRMSIANFFEELLDNTPTVAEIPVLTSTLPGADMDTLRKMADRFRQRHISGVAVLAGIQNGKPQLISVVSDDLVKRGLHAGELVKFLAKPLGGSGGGRPSMAQAGGKDSSKLEEVLKRVPKWVEESLKDK